MTQEAQQEKNIPIKLGDALKFRLHGRTDRLHRFELSPRAVVRQKWTVNLIGNELNGEPMVFDEENRDVFALLFDYFTGQKELNKGLFLSGNVGSGKTLAMTVFRVYTREVLKCNGFMMASGAEIVAQYQLQGFAGIEPYFSGNLCIDDLGAGHQEASHYGDKIEVLATVLDMRYQNYIQNGWLTHITTNLTVAKLCELYGDRIEDRLKQMCRLVPFVSSTSRRRPKKNNNEIPNENR